MANNLVINETPKYSLSVVDGTNLTLTLLGPTGPTGPANVLDIGTVTTAETDVPASASITGSSPNQLLNLTLPKGNTGSAGPQGIAGPNTITSSTSTDKTGYIFGNGTNIAGATTATSVAVANTLVLRAASTGTTSFNAISALSSSSTGVEATSVTGTGAQSESINGTYHHLFGATIPNNNSSAVERERGWFVWFYNGLVGRLKTADITENRNWTLPNASGTLTLDSHTHVISNVTGLQTALDDKSPAPASSFDLTYTGTLPPASTPILTTTPLRDALLGASGSQAATLRSGKWVTGININGFLNPTLDNLTTLSSSDIVGIRDSFILNNLTKLTTVSFPSLAAIGGSFTQISGTSNALTTVNFPALAFIGGSYAFTSSFTGSTSSIATVSYPALASVGIGFAFASGAGNNMSSLTSISFPALAFVGGAFSINNNSVVNLLNTMSFPALASIGGTFAVNGSSSGLNSITAMSFPALTTIGTTLSVSTNGPMNSLTAISFPVLNSVGDSINIFGGSSNTNSITTTNFPAIAFISGGFTITGGAAATTSLTTLLLGSGLKHLNGNFTSGNVGLDRHNAWSASTYYPSFTSFTAPASAFSAAGTSATCTVTITDHGLETGSLIIVSGLSGNTAGTHNFNTATGPVAVTRISSSQFSYTISATTQIATGTATIQRQEVTVTPVTKNGRKYTCTTAGTSGATEPTWPTTVGNTVADGTAIWTCSEMSQANILSRLYALDGTNQTITYGANRSISIAPTTLITVSSITTASGVATITTATNHGITTGTQVVISGCTGTALRYNGVWTVTNTGLNTLTATVPTDLNGVAGAGTMRLTTAAPQYTGDLPIASTSVVGAASDSHTIADGSAANLRDSDGGTVLPITPAGIYARNGTTNGFAKYSCAENGWDLWYDTTTKRWANTPSASTGSTTAVINYPNTPQAVAIASTSAANPAVITSSTTHLIATGAAFTVVIEGCSNAALNGSWTAISTGATTFTIPVSGAAGATTNSGTVAVLNQTLLKGRLMGSTVASPIQGVQQTITRNSHGFSNGDFIHFYGAAGTQAVSITDNNAGTLSKSTTTAITVTDLNTFTCIRYSTTQPFIGSYSLTTQPHMRRPSVNDAAYYSALRLRSRGVATSLHGTTGL